MTNNRKGLHSNNPTEDHCFVQLNFGIGSTLKQSSFFRLYVCFGVFQDVFLKSLLYSWQSFPVSYSAHKNSFNWTNICKQTRGANFLIWTLGLLNSCRGVDSGPNSENFLRNIFTLI